MEQVIKDFDSSWEYVSSTWHKRWQDNYYLYNNERVKVGYEGISNTFDPMTFSTVESLTSALFGTKPKFEYIPPSDKKDQKTDVLNSLLDYYWDKDQWTIKVINWGRDMIKLGTSVVYLTWSGDCPHMINVPIRDFFIDPTARDIESARFMGRRYLTTKEELESFEVINPETGKMEKKYKNLKKIKGGKTGENTDKQEKDMWYGSTVSGAEENQVEVIEYWTEDKTISVANRSVEIENVENYFKAQARKRGDENPIGLKPFAALRNYVDPSLFYAKGDVDFIADLQEDLNDLSNQNKDAITYTLNQMYTLDPRYADQIETIENLPGAVYPFEAGALQPIPMGNVPADAFNERVNIKTQMRETTASNEIVKGVGVEGQVTATEINAQIAGSGQRIGLKVSMIENEGFHQLAQIVFQMIRLYVNEPKDVRILGKDGAKWETFNPAEFDGDYEPRVQLDIIVEARKQDQANNAKEMLAAFMEDPDINQQELKKMVLAKSFGLEPDEVENLIVPMEMQMEEVMSEEMMPEDVGEMGDPTMDALMMQPPTEEELMMLQEQGVV